MIENLKTFLKQSQGKHFFVACSGGLDSMVLLQLVAASKVPFTVLHVNYQLRGEESDGDETFISEHCKTHGLPFESIRVDLGKILAENKGNLQNEARRIRYAYFKSHADKTPSSYLITAHHLTDQIETFWLQLFRGSGISGMAGMTAKNDFILRPLLPYSKSEILAFAQQNALKWREDASNQNPKYARNFLRQEALPFLRLQMPEIDSEVHLLQQVFQEELIAAKVKAVELSDKWRSTQRIELDDTNNNSIVFHEAMKLCAIPSVHFQALLDLTKAEKGKKLILENPSAYFKEIVKESRFLALVSNVLPPKLCVKTEVTTSLPESFNRDVWYIDGMHFTHEIELRPWEAGERMKPIGLKGSKKISDILKDFGIESNKKASHPIAILNGEILGIPGVCLSQKFMATQNSKRIIKVTFAPC